MMADIDRPKIGTEPKGSRNKAMMPVSKAPKARVSPMTAQDGALQDDDAVLPESVAAMPPSEPSAADAVTKPAPVEAVAILPAPDLAPLPTDDEPTDPVNKAPEEPSSKGTIDMATTFQETAATGTAAAAETAEKAKAMFGDMNSRAKVAMEKSVKLGEEMTEFAKGNVEAVVQSGRVAAKGAEALAQDAAETMKKHFESASAAMKSFASVKSPTELFQLQSDAAKSYFDTAVADMSKYTEQLMKLAGDVSQPLSSRYSVAMEKMKANTL